MDAPTDLVVGSLFAGRYRIVRRIAVGGMGAVYEVIHLETERRRALKIMHAHLFQSDELRDRFKREAKVAAQIDSEFIVDVFDAGIDETTGIPFLVMELLRGEELGERLKREGRLVPAEVLTYLHQIALALDKTHEAAIVHRDLKPANIFLTERAEGGVRVKILDFGIAKIVAEGATTGGATQSLGTPLYMAPEQFNPSMRLTPAADIFALGMMTYTLLVGAPYWADEARAGSLYALIAMAIQGPKEAATKRAARHGVALPPEFDNWFGRITAHAVTDRFPTAMAAVQSLADVLRLPFPQRATMLSTSGVFEPSLQIPSAPLVQTPPAVTSTPAQGKTFQMASASVPEATMSGASATSNTASKGARRPVFLVMAGGVVVLVGIAAAARMALRTPEPAAPPVQTVQTIAQIPAPPATMLASAPPVEIVSPEIPPSARTSNSAAFDGQSSPPARKSNEPAPRKTVSKPAPAKNLNVWDE